MRKKKCILFLLLFLCQFSYSQHTTYDNHGIFGTYTTVYGQSSPYHNDISYQVYEYETINTNNNISSPRKGKGDKYGEGTVTVDGVTVRYEIISDGDVLGIGWYTIYYYEGTQLIEETNSSFNWGTLKNTAEKHASELAKEIAEERRMTPVGSFYVLFLFCFLYINRKRLKNGEN